ncbi:MAG TPA: histidine kinase [Bacteroidales bacterium]|nr:histidine kinase [Bacteroidales bacterium]
MKNPFLNRKFSISYAIVWVVFIISQIAVLSLFTNANVLTAIIQSLLSNISFAILGLGIWFVVKYNLGNNNIVQTITVFLISGIIVIGLWMGFNFIIQNLIFKLSIGSISFVNHPLYQFVIGVFLYIIMVLIFRLLILFHKYGEKAKSEEVLQKLVTETRLNALKAYINPHFLFNSLNSVNALISSDQEKAREMLINLSDYFRYSLKQKDIQFVSFEEEIHYTLTYFKIEQQRFGEKIIFKDDICEDCKIVQVPVMILQPLFENIIKHAVAESLVTINVIFKANIIDGLLNVELINNYDKDGIPKKGTGIGLSTTSERLAIIYERKDLIEYSKKDELFKLIIKIPVDF